MTEVRFAIIGVGGIGRQHVGHLKELPRARLVAVAAPRDTAARQIGQEARCAWTTKYGDIIKRDDVDAVLVAIPHRFHPAVAIEAMEAGKHVLCEKPLAVTVGDAERMIEASRRTSRRLGVIFQQRTQRTCQKIREVIASGELGELHRASMLMAILRPQFYFEDSGWRGSWEGEGGGVVLNQAAHYLDLFQWYFGLPQEVCAWCETSMHDISAEDVANVLVRLDGEAHGQIYLSSCEAPERCRFEVYGDRGILLAEGSEVRIGRLPVNVRDHIRARQPWQPPQAAWEQLQVEPLGWAGHTEVMKDFVDAVIEDRDPMVPGEEALKSLELQNAIILSGQTRRWVTLPVDRWEYLKLIDQLRQAETMGRRTRGL